MSAPSVIRATFPGSSGDDLAARLELPEGPVRAFALFAHCFSCTKDILAARRIASGLATAGVAVLRFDFTGLGSSEGDFANTDFSSNVEDLIRAADYLRRNYEAPIILIGHSLGGAAVLVAAERIPESKAVVTISAPADVAHVLRQLGGSLDRIRSEGEAEVKLAGRPFRIRRSFVEDAEMQRLEEKIRTLGRALLVLHAPRDEVVGIGNASRIFLPQDTPRASSRSTMPTTCCRDRKMPHMPRALSPHGQRGTYPRLAQKLRRRSTSWSARPAKGNSRT